MLGMPLKLDIGGTHVDELLTATEDENGLLYEDELNPKLAEDDG